MPQSLTTLMKIRGVEKTFNISSGFFNRHTLHVLNHITLDLYEGKTLALVGESGCGKTTLGKTILGLYAASKGSILFQNEEIAYRTPTQRGSLQQQLQMIFQDPYASLNPRKHIETILDQPLRIHTDMRKSERKKRIEALCLETGIDPTLLQRYPHQFSGGQRQRIAIARAMMLHPKLILADEPVASLDVSIQAQILNLMMELQRTYRMAMLFITHDLAVVRYISDFVAVMYLGEIVEYASKETLFKTPMHPYTRMLFASVPTLHNHIIREAPHCNSETPSPLKLPKGCFFANRCPVKTERCEERHPELHAFSKEHLVRCPITIDAVREDSLSP